MWFWWRCYGRQRRQGKARQRPRRPRQRRQGRRRRRRRLRGPQRLRQGPRPWQLRQGRCQGHAWGGSDAFAGWLHGRQPDGRLPGWESACRRSRRRRAVGWRSQGRPAPNGRDAAARPGRLAKGRGAAGGHLSVWRRGRSIRVLPGRRAGAFRELADNAGDVSPLLHHAVAKRRPAVRTGHAGLAKWPWRYRRGDRRGPRIAGESQRTDAGLAHGWWAAGRRFAGAGHTRGENRGGEQGAGADRVLLWAGQLDQGFIFAAADERGGLGADRLGRRL
mmetsp:Transcript_108872/g.314393  ORF Transcript_108872/g.314393 Transcript_108872/m.314393 type:complete len:276 (-) Transcript_108872:797-1624(-)